MRRLLRVPSILKLRSSGMLKLTLTLELSVGLKFEVTMLRTVRPLFQFADIDAPWKFRLLLIPPLKVWPCVTFWKTPSVEFSETDRLSLNE